MHYRLLTGLLGLLLLTGSCRKKTDDYPTGGLFERVPPDSVGIGFVNAIRTSDSVNLFTYEYLYNGGGVGIGDFDRDGRPDVLLTGNQVPSRLYLNRSTPGWGNLRFDDATDRAGLQTDGWTFGVTVADVNADGWDDIYLSKGAGNGKGTRTPNQLFINQGTGQGGVPTFREMAAEYGLDSPAETIQTLFFDYDRDGDLDLYQLTGGGFERPPISVYPIRADGSAFNTDRLLRNMTVERKLEERKERGGKITFQPVSLSSHSSLSSPRFVDVSKETGIQLEGYGLGVSLIDVNDDGWPDVYVSNDYQSNDHLYVNQRDGTFRDEARRYFKHTSHFAMGNDVGDVNNDGLPDLVVMDMLPHDHYRRKLMLGPNHYDKFMHSLREGYLPQYMRNTLQINTGRGFSEVGQLAGIHQTDWSWSVLLADLDNDEHQDLFITNGFGKDVTDLDFVKFRNQDVLAVTDRTQRLRLLNDSLSARPGLKTPNFAYRNRGDGTFDDATKPWGFDRPDYSHGAAYADLDGDGDLDLVVNNTDEPAAVFRNTLREKNPSGTNYLRVRLDGPAGNRAGVGSRVTLRYAGRQQVRVQSPTRGFQSSVDPCLHVGLGRQTRVDTLEVRWPDGRLSVTTGVRANQVLTVDYAKSEVATETPQPAPTLVQAVPTVPAHVHAENEFADFKYEPLLPHKFSQNGPGLAVGDVNGDGLDDYFVGGEFQKPGTFFLQKKAGTFERRPLTESSPTTEDLGCLLFDADGDGDNDLYVANGGNEFSAGHAGYKHQLYRNDGKGNFTPDPFALPDIRTSGSCVVAGDYDHDGDLDLFVGGRVVPGQYPTAPESFLLRNDGGKFTDATDAVAPGLRRVGMVTSALWTDYDNDHQPDLLVVGEWMAPTFFKNEKGLFNPQSAIRIPQSEGWWNSLVGADFDNDGDVDYVAGNLGLNSHYRASDREPMRVVYGDFNQNGTTKPILAYAEGGVMYPEPSLDGLTEQLPYLKKRLLYYRTYAATPLDGLLALDGMGGGKSLECRTLVSTYFENRGNGTFAARPLPTAAQVAPLYGLLAEDVNGDGNLDLLAVGNSYAPEVVYGRMDALVGLTLLGDGKGGFHLLPVGQSGFFVDGDGKALARLRTASGETRLLATQNNGPLLTFRLPRSAKAVVPAPGEQTARLRLKSGRQRRVELPHGSGYLSQSSWAVTLNAAVESVEFFDNRGRPTRRLPNP